MILQINVHHAAVNDPLRFRPNPSNLVSKLPDENSESDNEEDDEGMSVDDDELSKLYVPPRVMAMPYQEDTKRTRQHVSSKVVHSSLIQELRDEFTDAPTEVKVSQKGCLGDFINFLLLGH